MLFDQVRVESIMSSRHWRVRGKDEFSRYTRHSFVKGQSFLVHAVVNRFEHRESAVPFIQVQNTGGDPHCFECAEPSDAQQQFLSDSYPAVPSVEFRG